jgi:hypoxanthine phosphoribosyltransferase
MLRNLSWGEYDHLVSRIKKQLNDQSFDLIVGIARGGLPLAIQLSHQLQCRDFGVIIQSKTKNDSSFAIEQQSIIKLVGDPILPNKTCKNILITEDVIALGDGFSLAEKLIKQKYGEDVNITFTSLFVDVQQVKRGPYNHMLNSIRYGEDIDNKKIWIEFPWEKTEKERN